MKPIIKKHNTLLIQSSTQKLLEVFYLYPDKEFSLSDLAIKAKVAKPHVGRILAKLEKNNLIAITKLSKIWRISANLDNQDFIRNKLLYNLNFMFASRIIDFLNELYTHPRAIILFGSFRKGEDISSSDIDIAIEMDENKIYSTEHLSELQGFEKMILRRIQIHQFGRKSIDKNIYSNIINGIVLSGFLEVEHGSKSNQISAKEKTNQKEKH